MSGPADNEMLKKLGSKRVLVITKLFNIAVNDFDTKKYARCSRTFIIAVTYFGAKKWTVRCNRTRYKKECIPVGCVPSAAVAVGGGG